MNPLAPALAFALLCIVIVLYERSPSACPDSPKSRQVEVALDIDVHKAAIKALRTQKAELEAVLSGAANQQLQGLGTSTGLVHTRSLKSWGADDPIPKLSEIPRPPTKEKVLAAVDRDNPECLAAVDRAFSRHNLNSQYSQDWFVYMNYLHHLPNGFYVDVGASGPKENSNTWFFDVCLGWNGICIEADPTLAAALRKYRKCTVVNACIAHQNMTMALQAPGLLIGKVVPVANKGDRGIIVQCRTLEDILREIGISHIDLLSIDTEGSEAGVLATFPEDDEVTVDVVLVSNEKGDVTRPPCFRSNPLRFPFFNREYALVNLLGDDVWVKLTRPSLWRLELIYPRLSPEREKSMRKRYTQNPQYTPAMVDKLLMARDPNSR